MCRKSIYYNTYGDGSEDVTERVDTCHPGMMCSRPHIREFQRKFRFTKLGNDQRGAGSSPSSYAHGTTSGLADRLPTPYNHDFLELPPTPRRSKSPSPSGSNSGVYVNGSKIADIPGSSSKRHSGSHRSHHRRRHDRDSVVLFPQAPQPPSPLLKRSNTLPSYANLESPRGRSRHRVGSPDTSSSSSSPHYIHRGSRRHRRHDREEPRSSSHRRRSRHDLDPRIYLASSPPTTPAAAAVRKELRWRDQVTRAEIAAQNDRISRRPRGSFVQLHQEGGAATAVPRGILKNAPAAAAPPSPDPDTYEELRRAVERMDLARHHGSASRRRADGAATGQDAAYWDRLRDRFDEGPRERKRHRSRVVYPDDGMYRYL